MTPDLAQWPTVLFTLYIVSQGAWFLYGQYQKRRTTDDEETARRRRVLHEDLTLYYNNGGGQQLRKLFHDVMTEHEIRERADLVAALAEVRADNHACSSTVMGTLGEHDEQLKALAKAVEGIHKVGAANNRGKKRRSK